MRRKKLLVIHQGALGDVVVTFPALLALKNKFPLIHGLCQGRLGRLMKYLGLVDHAYPLESAAFASFFSDALDSRVKRLLASYDAVLVFSFSSDLEENLKRATKHPVHRVSPRPEPAERQHVADYIKERLQSTGLIDPGHKYKARPPHPFHRPAAGMNPSKPYRVIIHPGSGSPKKNWPLSRFMEVAGRLESLGIKPKWVLGPAEYHFRDELNRNGVNVDIMDDLIDLTQAFMHTAGFVGNDSGVSHLSAYLGLPTVVIFGPSDPARWGPMGNYVRIVGSHTQDEDIQCNPCFETWDGSCDSRECLEHIFPTHVINALMEILPDPLDH